MIRFVSSGIVKLKDAARYRPDDPARYTDLFFASFPADRGLFLDLFALQALAADPKSGGPNGGVLLVHRRSGTYFFWTFDER